jgi:hypothetical protein
MATRLARRTGLDLRKARELIDGHAPGGPFRDLGEPSWFVSDVERRGYWLEHAAEIVAWARAHGFAHPSAAFRYGMPGAAHAELWAWSD